MTLSNKNVPKPLTCASIGSVTANGKVNFISFGSQATPTGLPIFLNIHAVTHHQTVHPTYLHTPATAINYYTCLTDPMSNPGEGVLIAPDTRSCDHHIAITGDALQQLTTAHTGQDTLPDAIHVPCSPAMTNMCHAVSAGDPVSMLTPTSISGSQQNLSAFLICN